MLVNRGKAKQLMMCSMYWGLDMIASLKDLLEDETIQCGKEFKDHFGRRALGVLIGEREVTFVEYARVCEDVIEELKFIYDRDTESMNTNMEALSFFANQIVKLVNDVCELMILMGFEAETKSMLNELGSEVMGFNVEREISCI
ncbi:hypothetical protein [Virgibacillus ndiopensis]|uniref:hypothetical protein n=1 Tax=Virgibacillus ndiopensis TaxID=2004408 RepID=UPI000C08AD34|nr:hypothetical protein [Virgibacillus ndiopensis]